MKLSTVFTLFALCLSITGCRSGAFQPTRVRADQLVRPVANQGDLLLGQVELGYDHTHVLGVVAGPQVTRIALLPTPSPERLGIAESYLVEVTLAGADPEVAGTVHVYEPTGLSVEGEWGGGTTRAMAVFAGQRLDGTPRPQVDSCGDLAYGLAAVRRGRVSAGSREGVSPSPTDSAR
jgi:hypothetical protein